MKIWTCPAGTFKGTESEICHELYGIRYAESERFCKPVRYIYSEGVHSCSTKSPYALQLHSKPEAYLFGIDYSKIYQEESCQYLSITIPKGANEGDSLPVMVWIHGGAFRNGGNDHECYDSDLLAHEGNVIVVRINYRLGTLGFVKDENGDSANLGLLDAISALEWIRENIEGFGGDPANVTLFGQSAGAQIIAGLIVADRTDNLFKNAIMHSTPLGAMKGREAMDARMLEQLNEMPIDASEEQLREKQGYILNNIKEKGLPKFMPFAPHYGVAPLPSEDKIPEVFKERASRHSIMIGFNTREASAYVGDIKLIAAFDSFPLTRWIVEIILKIMSKRIFGTPSKEFARQYAKAGGKSWFYEFSWGKKNAILKACHCMELVLLFGGKSLIGREITMGMSEDEIIKTGEELRSVWYNFAKTGEVKTKGIPDMIDIKKFR